MDQSKTLQENAEARCGALSGADKLPVAFELHAFPLTNRPRAPVSPRSPAGCWLDIFGGHCFALEGIIGAGKTTLLRDISACFELHGMPCKIFYEDVPMDLLTKFLEYEQLKSRTPQRDDSANDGALEMVDTKPDSEAEAGIGSHNPHAFTLQREMLRRRIAIYEEGCALAEREQKAVFFDRSLLGDVVFAAMHRDAGRMRPSEASEYAQALDAFRNSGNNVDLTLLLYLQCDPAEALKRVVQRTQKLGGGAELGYGIAYLQELEEMYERVIEAYETAHISASSSERPFVLILDGASRSEGAEMAEWCVAVLRQMASVMLL